ncbi:sensor histidine kinase [Halalkalibacter flavus]|uniref:sensor histidine kinase n=1 Tax=Halalkalibacter flavus TaxID=3090668 RepID=UPI002FCA2A48
MKEKNATLKTLFLVRVLLASLILVLVSGSILLYYTNQQIVSEVNKQSTMTAQSIKREVENTNLAARSLEHQIDLKLISFAKLAAERLQGKRIGDITNQDLLVLREELELAGITLFAREGDDIVGVRSTDPHEIGFSFKEYGYYETVDTLLKGEKVRVEGATLVDNHVLVLPVAQSGSQQEEPVFFKYGYYHPPGSSYIINPYIEVGEVENLLNEVGPSSSMEQMKTNNPYLDEVAILNPKVFVDPSLEDQLYPPLKQIVHGTYNNKSEQDLDVLKDMVTNPEKNSYIEEINGKKLYKVFLPFGADQVIYTAFDYGEMSEPLTRQAILIIVTGSISILVMYLITSQFFKRIYRRIDVLVRDVGRISKGEYGVTTASDEQYEFKKLTEAVNHMSVSLQHSFENLSNEKLYREQILASIPIGIITVQIENSKIVLNSKAKEVTNLDEVEINRLYKDKVISQVNEEFWDLFYSEDFFHTRKVSYQSSDLSYILLVSQSPLVDDKKNVIGRIFYFVDVSEIDKLEKRVLRTEKLALAGELASKAAHEIKNPLSVIQGFIQLMNSNFSESERSKYHTLLILKEIQRINSIAQDMLMLAKPNLNKKKANLADVIEEIMPFIHSNYSSNIFIRSEIDSITLNIDVDQMKQVFLNLIINSIQAMEEKGEISISSEVYQDRIHIFIKDNGSGVPEEIQSNLFEPFVSSKETGTGLGLTIIERIITSHDGTIQLLSSNEEGTCFKIALPLVLRG